MEANATKAVNPPTRRRIRSLVQRSDLSIRIRLIACFVLIVLLMIAADAVAVWQFRQIMAPTERLSKADQTAHAIVSVHLDIDTFRDSMAALASSHDTREFASKAASIRRTFLQHVDQAEQVLRGAPDLEQDVTTSSALESLRVTLLSQLDTAVQLAAAGEWDVVRLRLANQIPALIEFSSLLVERVDRAVVQQRSKAINETERARQRLFIIVPIAALLALLAAATLGWYVTRTITGIEIQDRKRAEKERERLRQLEADLAHMNRVSLMGEFAASLAHEIKQPIAAAATDARTCMRWLQRESPDIHEACETASRIIKDVNRAADIIDRNRALYRRDMPKREMLDLNELIREMIVLTHDAANRHSIPTRAELDTALPTITADRVQMQQVLMNLMLNGIEAMKDTGGELTVTSGRTDDSQLLISVSDSGIGLPADKLETIFDAFFTTKAQGTGMGLSISRRIIESHGGRLWATPNSGGGATFHCTLPAAVEPVELPPEEPDLNLRKIS
jgi:signal transduction histidine kinase